jgi:hypothetical protein
MLKLLTVLVAGVLTVVTLKRLFELLQAQRAVRVTTRQANPPSTVTRLRQDPQSGVYYPEG